MLMRVLSPFIAVVALSLMLSPMAQADSSVHKGNARLVLRTIYAVDQTGADAPDKDAVCHEKFGNLNRQEIRTEYEINPKTMIMKAISRFQGHEFTLSALGIARTYAFAAFYKPPFSHDLPLYSVQFMISTKFKEPVSRLALNYDSQTTCVVTSERSKEMLEASMPVYAPAKP